MMDTNALLSLVQVVTVPELQVYRLSAGNIFLVFFIMLGPLKVIGQFAVATRELAPAAVRVLAFKAFALSVAALLLGGLLGSRLLGNWQISAPILQLTGGIIFVLVSLQIVLAQYHEVPAVPAHAPSLMHLVSPVIITPYGMAIVIVLLAIASSTTRALQIMGIATAVLVLDLLAMLAARFIVRWVGLPLQILGAVLGVMQVALGLKILVNSLAALGVDVIPS